MTYKQELNLLECRKIGYLIEKALNLWLMDPKLNKEELINILKEN